jgi:hypothetical protein
MIHAALAQIMRLLGGFHALRDQRDIQPLRACGWRLTISAPATVRWPI